MNVSLTPELEKLIHRKVETGRYLSASEVVREALRLLEKHDQLQSLPFEEPHEANGGGPEGVVEPGDEAAVLAAQLAENGRRSLNPMEEARAFQKLKEHLRTQARIARETGRSTSDVTRSLALLELPEQVRNWVEAGRIKPSSAYELTKVPNPETRMGLALLVVSGELVHAELVAKVQEIKNRHEIQIGLDQADRGEVAPLDVPGTLANVRRRRNGSEDA